MTQTHRVRVWLRLTVACSVLALPVQAASQASDADRAFQRGLTALHEFEYEEANEAFREAQKHGPGFAMAFWGEAMTYHQSLWRRENIDAARQTLARLAPTHAARIAKCRSPKEADLFAAVEILFGRGDASSRRRAYAEAMGAVHERYPDDADTAALYGLSLLATMARGLSGSVDVHEGHSQDLAGSDTQARVAGILERVLGSHPDHRGALHYLLHTYDDPAHASRALDHARRYAKIAEASHARHMPAHIVPPLGPWDEAAASDRAAFDASVQWTERNGLAAALRNFHALSWLQYELLQLGRYREAEQTISAMEPVVKAGGNTILLSDLSSMRARQVVETERWDLMAAQDTFANVNDLFAIGLSAVRSGRGPVADRVRGVLAERAQAKEEGDLKPAIAVMERELAGLIALAAGRTDEALAILGAAAQAELNLPAPVGLPQPIKPAPELLGEVLMQIGRPGEAVVWFERALSRNANRSRSIAGLARAAAASGRSDTARQRYRELLNTLSHADEGLPNLAEARAALQTPVPPADASPSRALILSGSVAAALAAALFIVRRRGRGRNAAPAKPERKGRKGRKGR